MQPRTHLIGPRQKHMADDLLMGCRAKEGIQKDVNAMWTRVDKGGSSYHFLAAIGLFSSRNFLTSSANEID